MRGKMGRQDVQSLVADLEPAFEARSITHSYACRPGKGMHAAVARARALVRRHPYFWKGDLQLSLKEPASIVAPVSEGVPFLGLRIYPGTARLGRSARDRFRRGWETRPSNHRSGRMSEERFLASAASATGHVAHASTFRLRTQVLEAVSSVG